MIYAYQLTTVATTVIFFSFLYGEYVHFKRKLTSTVMRYIFTSTYHADTLHAWVT